MRISDLLFGPLYVLAVKLHWPRVALWAERKMVG